MTTKLITITGTYQEVTFMESYVKDANGKINWKIVGKHFENSVRPFIRHNQMELPKRNPNFFEMFSLYRLTVR